MGDFNSSKKRRRSTIINNENYMIVSSDVIYKDSNSEDDLSPPTKKHSCDSDNNQSYVGVSKSKSKKRKSSTYEEFVKELSNNSLVSSSRIEERKVEHFDTILCSTPDSQPSGEEPGCNEKDDPFPDFLNSIAILPDSDNEQASFNVDDVNTSKHGKRKALQKRSREPDFQSASDSDNADEALSKIEGEKAVFKGRIIQKSENVCVVRIPSKSTEILLLTHPASVTLLKHITVRVLSGGVSIFGYQVDSQNSPVKIFSSPKTGLINLSTEYTEQIWKKKDLYKTVEKTLRIISSANASLKILSMCGNSTVIVILERCLYPPPIQFLKLYFPYVFQLKQKIMRAQDHTFCQINPEGSLKFSTYCEDIAEEIKVCIRRTKIKHMHGPRIVIFGEKQSGKSSLLRFLINKVLYMFHEVYYLDADPGQTEFTPPGVVSLTKVTKPLLGPPFMHLKRPVRMIFTGSVTAETSPDMYDKSIRRLMEYYTSTYSFEPLFVNTMGWITGVGADCLRNVMKAVNPTVLIHLVRRDKVVFDCSEFLKKNVKYIPINITGPRGDYSGFKGFEMRQFAQLSYLGQCQSPFLKPLYLNYMQPYCVCWDKIAVYVFGRRLPPYRLVEALNGSIVALCSVDEHLILENELSYFQNTLKDEPDNNCLGFGVVRAVDEKNHLLFVVTPLPLKELKKVTAIMKGNILLPKEVLLQQSVDYTALPFTDQPAGAPTAARKRVQKRVRRQLPE